jgi:hypothetical protein
MAAGARAALGQRRRLVAVHCDGVGPAAKDLPIVEESEAGCLLRRLHILIFHKLGVHIAKHRSLYVFNLILLRLGRRLGNSRVICWVR